MEQRQLPPESLPSSNATRDASASQGALLEEEDNTATAKQEANEDLEALRNLLQEEATGRSKEELTSIIWSLSFLVLMVWSATRTVSDISSLRMNLLLCVTLMGVLGVGTCSRTLSPLSSPETFAGEILATTKHIRHVEPLVQSLRVGNTRVRNLAKQTLIELLPTLQSSDTHLLSEADRKILIRQLQNLAPGSCLLRSHRTVLPVGASAGTGSASGDLKGFGTGRWRTGTSDRRAAGTRAAYPLQRGQNPARVAPGGPGVSALPANARQRAVGE